MSMEASPVVGLYKAGDHVPDWVLSVDPDGASHARLAVVFRADCYVLPIHDCIVILPLEGGHKAICQCVNLGEPMDKDELDKIAASVYAPTKPVRIVLSWQTIGRDGGYDPDVFVDLPPLLPEIVQG